MLPSGVFLRPLHRVSPWGLPRGGFDSARGTSSGVGLPPPQTVKYSFLGSFLLSYFFVRVVQGLQDCRDMLSGVCDDSLMSELL